MDNTREIAKLRNLNCYKNKTDAELELVLLKKQEKQAEKEDKIEFEPKWSGLSDSEKKWAKARFEDYKKDYSIINLSDLVLLENLIFIETLQEQYKRKIQQLTEAAKNIPNGLIIPDNILKALREFQEQEIELREKLGLFEDKKKDDFLSIWTSLKKKINIHANENRGAFQFKCPTCGNLALLVKKVSDFETCDFKMFKGTWLYNEHMFKLYDEGKLTFEDIGKFFGLQSIDYIKKIYEKIYLPEKKAKETAC